MGVCRVRLQREVRFLHARYHSRHAATGERRQVRVRMPLERKGERLRVYGIRQAVNGSLPVLMNRSEIKRSHSICADRAARRDAPIQVPLNLDQEALAATMRT